MNKLIRAKPEDCKLEDWLSDQLSKIESTKTRVADVESELHAATLSYEKHCKEMQNKLVQLRKECGHPITTFNGDPSGNNDSFMRCDVCGKEGKRL